MRKPHVFWLGVIGALGVLDYALDRRHDGSTLSEVVREAFCTDRPAGRIAFTLVLTGGGFVFHRHIIGGNRWARCSTS